MHLYVRWSTLNSCTSRSDVCQSLVVNIPMDNMSKNKAGASTIMPRKQGCNRAHGRILCRAAPHLVQKPNAGTVYDSLTATVQAFNSCTSRPDVSQCVVIHIPVDNMSKNKPSTSMTQVACESNLRSVIRSSMHPCRGNWVAIRRAVA